MSQRFIQGRGCSFQIEKVLHQLGIRKYLLVCGKSLDLQPIWEKIQKSSIPFVRFDSFSSNPLYEDVCKGVEIFRNEKCDCIVAIGGGSSTDVAKCIKLFSPMDETEDLHLRQTYKSNDVPFIAMPTTSGTGSESTHFAVVYYHGEKRSVSHESLLPDIVFLDSQFLETLPLYQKKCTMLDALCQAIESWWSVKSNDESIGWSKKAIPMILDNMDGYLKNEKKANENMLLAANYAGRAINITTTTAPHAMSYKLTSMFHIPHGHAVAICLPVVWEYMNNHVEDCVDPRGPEYLHKTFLEIANSLGRETVYSAIEGFKNLLEKLDIPKLKFIGSLIVKELASSVNTERLHNNPVLIDSSVLEKFYQDLMSAF